IFARVRACEIQIHLALADSQYVSMRIGHSGDNGAATKIDNARFVARQLFRIFIRADERNPVLLHCNRFGVRLALVDRVNVPVNEDEIDPLRAWKAADWLNRLGRPAPSVRLFVRRHSFGLKALPAGGGYRAIFCGAHLGGDETEERDTGETRTDRTHSPLP